MRRSLLLSLTALLFVSISHAQEKPKWDVSNPPGNFKEVAFTVNEGTWMNLDVSPDGKEIVFDLLGDVYSMAATGGNARVLRGGLAFEVQPRFSPDGKKILFTSDAGGGDNIWVMNRDGSNAKQVTKEDFRLLNNAVWSPDGNYIVARKHFTSQRSLGAGELWLYHVSGGTGLQLTPRKNDQQDLNEPCFSPDGQYVYYSEDMYPGGSFQYNKDPNNQVFVIKRFDRNKGTSETVTGGPGGAVRPQLSHDGKTLAFVKRVRTKTVLCLRNLETAEEWPVYDQLSKDQQEAWTIFGIYTGYAFSPDDRFIYVWANGKINKVEVSGFNKSTDVPFTANVKQKIYDAVRFKQQLGHDPEQFLVHAIRNATTSPDGKWLLFNAVGSLWKKELPNGTPQRLTNRNDFEYDPAFAPDGKSIAFVGWNDTASGSLYTLQLKAGATPIKISKGKGIYRTPEFSADGKQIVFEKEAGSNAMGPAFTAKPGIYLMPSDGGAEKFVTDKGSSPRFNAKGDRIYYHVGDDMNSSFASCKTDGTDDRTHLKSTYGSQFTVSPDEQWVAFIDLHKAYIASFPHTGKTIDLGSATTDFPVKQVAKDAGFNLHWSADSKRLHYTLGSEYFTVDLNDRFEFVGGKPDSLFKMPEKGIDAGLQLPMDKPQGIVAFTNARIITMKGNEVIENGTVLVEGNKIKAVGINVSIPVNAKQIDCSGKTLMPGIIDAHAHGHHFSGMSPQQFWPYYANLAYGVTTMHDPSANTEWVFAQSELQKAGKIVGPRVFSTGTILYGADGNFKAVVNSLEDARSAIRRTKAFGAFSVKSYNQPRREQRQMIITAARELGIEVVPEGGSFFYHNTSMILDGHTTIEHNIPVATLYDDMIQLWKNAGTAYTPTLIVSYGSASGEYYWYQHSNVWEKERLLKYTPRSIVDTRSRRRTMLPEEEYTNGHILVSQQVKKLNDAGVKVNLGAHGQLQGLGAHWELWMMQQGGMSNHDALKTATINPAQSLGLDDFIGSIEVGKLADLLVMDKNPLEDIRNSESIRFTMINGRLFDAETMSEIGNYNKPRHPFYWEQGKNYEFFPLQGHADGEE